MAEDGFEEEFGWFKGSYIGVVPPPRFGQSYVSAGPTIIMFGGGTEMNVFNDAWLLDTTRMTWHKISPAGTLPMQRSGHSSVLFGADMLVFGGFNQVCSLSDLWILDLEFEQWIPVTVTGVIPPPRHRHAALRFGNKMVVFGGATTGEKSDYLNDMYMFDTNTLGWTKINPTNALSPEPRAGHSFTLIQNKFYVFGGIGKRGFLNDLWEFDPTTLRWKELCSKKIRPPIRANHAVCTYGVEPEEPYKYSKLIISGGHVSNKKLGDIWEYDVLSDEFIKYIIPIPPEAKRPQGNMESVMPNVHVPYPRSGHYIFKLDDGKLSFVNGITHETRKILNDFWVLCLGDPHKPVKQTEEEESKAPAELEKSQVDVDEEKSDEEKEEATVQETDEPNPADYDDEFRHRQEEEDLERRRNRRERRIAAAKAKAVLYGTSEEQIGDIDDTTKEETKKGFEADVDADWIRVTDEMNRLLDESMTLRENLTAYAHHNKKCKKTVSANDVRLKDTLSLVKEEGKELRERFTLDVYQSNVRFSNQQSEETQMKQTLIEMGKKFQTTATMKDGLSQQVKHEAEQWKTRNAKKLQSDLAAMNEPLLETTDKVNNKNELIKKKSRDETKAMEKGMAEHRNIISERKQAYSKSVEQAEQIIETFPQQAIEQLNQEGPGSSYWTECLINDREGEVNEVAEVVEREVRKEAAVQKAKLEEKKKEFQRESMLSGKEVTETHKAISIKREQVGNALQLAKDQADHLTRLEEIIEEISSTLINVKDRIEVLRNNSEEGQQLYEELNNIMEDLSDDHRNNQTLVVENEAKIEKLKQLEAERQKKREADFREQYDELMEGLRVWMQQNESKAVDELTTLEHWTNDTIEQSAEKAEVLKAEEGEKIRLCAVNAEEIHNAKLSEMEERVENIHDSLDQMIEEDHELETEIKSILDKQQECEEKLNSVEEHAQEESDEIAQFGSIIDNCEEAIIQNKKVIEDADAVRREFVHNLLSNVGDEVEMNLSEMKKNAMVTVRQMETSLQNTLREMQTFSEKEMSAVLDQLSQRVKNIGRGSTMTAQKLNVDAQMHLETHQEAIGLSDQKLKEAETESEQMRDSMQALSDSVSNSKQSICDTILQTAKNEADSVANKLQAEFGDVRQH